MIANEDIEIQLEKAKWLRHQQDRECQFAKTIEMLHSALKKTMIEKDSLQQALQQEVSRQKQVWLKSDEQDEL